TERMSSSKCATRGRASRRTISSASSTSSIACMAVIVSEPARGWGSPFAGGSSRPMVVASPPPIASTAAAPSSPAACHWTRRSNGTQGGEGAMASSAPCVLVVDDEPAIRRLLRNTLAVQDYRIVEAATGKDALDEARREKPDLVILDLGLPDLDGME